MVLRLAVWALEPWVPQLFYGKKSKAKVNNVFSRGPMLSVVTESVTRSLSVVILHVLHDERLFAEQPRSTWTSY